MPEAFIIIFIIRAVSALPFIAHSVHNAYARFNYTIRSNQIAFVSMQLNAHYAKQMRIMCELKKQKNEDFEACDLWLTTVSNRRTHSIESTKNRNQIIVQRPLNCSPSLVSASFHFDFMRFGDIALRLVDLQSFQRNKKSLNLFNSFKLRLWCARHSIPFSLQFFEPSNSSLNNSPNLFGFRKNAGKWSIFLDDVSWKCNRQCSISNDFQCLRIRLD